MNDTTQVKAHNQVDVREDSGTTVSTEVDKVILGGIVGCTAVIGLWSVACLTSAMIQAGGPLQLVAGYFRALAGI